MKNYIGISIDCSGSMQSIRQAAARDYNSQVTDLKGAAASFDVNTMATVVKCGIGPGPGRVERWITNSNISVVPIIPPGHYQANGGSTPLWDSIGELITILENVPDANDPEVSFVLMVITDGAENSSRVWSARRLTAKIQELQATDRWSFTFRVPTGNRRVLTGMGIPDGNIYEWDGRSESSLQAATTVTSQAINQFYSAKSKGIHSTQKFYADLSKVTGEQVAAVCEDVSAQVQFWTVSAVDDGAELRPFVEGRTGKPLLKGAAFYALVRTEPLIQPYKKICIRDKQTNAIYSGDAARMLLKVPNNVNIRLAPDKSGKYDIFVQSTSVNRKLVKNTLLLYWPAAGVPFKEGRSARNK